MLFRSYGGNDLVFAEIGTDMTYNGMKKYWHIPANGLGKTSDGGTRIHSITKYYVKDDQGREGCYLLTFKTMNGMGLYFIAEDGFGSTESAFDNKVKANIVTDGTVIKVSQEASEIAVYDIAGKLVSKTYNASEIAAPARGIYIVKAIVSGTSVTAKVIL